MFFIGLGCAIRDGPRTLFFSTKINMIYDNDTDYGCTAQPSVERCSN